MWISCVLGWTDGSSRLSSCTLISRINSKLTAELIIVLQNCFFWPTRSSEAKLQNTEQLIALYHPNRPLCSENSALLVVTWAFQIWMGGWALNSREAAPCPGSRRRLSLLWIKSNQIEHVGSQQEGSGYRSPGCQGLDVEFALSGHFIHRDVCCLSVTQSLSFTSPFSSLPLILSPSDLVLFGPFLPLTYERFPRDIMLRECSNKCLGNAVCLWLILKMPLCWSIHKRQSHWTSL